jgi:hypothetical protein
MFTGRLDLSQLTKIARSPLGSLRPAAGEGGLAIRPGADSPAPAPKPEDATSHTGFIVLRLAEAGNDPEADRVESLAELAERFKLEALARALDNFGLGRGRRLVTSVPPERLRGMESRARQSPFPPLRSLLSYWLLDLRKDPGRMDEVIKTLRALPGVADAYPHLAGEDPAPNPADEPYSGNQGYLDPAPDGIDARWAWTQPNGSGGGVAVTDMEQGWRLTHEDLSPAAPSLIFGDNRPSSYNHGCAVLGAMIAADNTVGVIGIAPDAGSVRCSSHYDAGLGVNGFVSGAVVAAIDAMAPGDVLLIEYQTGSRPAEIVDDSFDAIRLASALGIIVCEAAANGGADLDAYTNAAGLQILNPASVDFRDSGAIMVGACLDALPHNRKAASNFGARVDCFAWGDNVASTCYGDLDDGGPDADRAYTADFENTSAATPQIAGAALIVQSMTAAATGARISAAQMRLILSDPATGTAQGPGVAGNIGIMPDLRAILEGMLGVSSDVYLRDNIGDDGSVPTAGGISASPDIIVRPIPVPDPQTAFGEGSGTEGSQTLGSAVEAGQDNHIYVRMRNRGGTAANNVTCTVYWSPVSTLVTPAMWTQIGVTSPVNVPVGDILTVTDGLIWPEAEIPGEGHYCLVGVLDHAADPAPVLPPPTDFDGFRSFIRNQNNVTWRNFNVVDNIDDPSADPSALPFLVVNFPDRRRVFDFVIERRLPEEAWLWIEVPLALAKPFCARVDLDCRIDKKRQTARIALPRAARMVVPEVLLPAEARLTCRFVVEGLSKYGRPGHGIAIGQHYKGEELGRVSWRFDRKRDPKRIC